jgi:hypothetical protein
MWLLHQTLVFLNLSQTQILLSHLRCQTFYCLSEDLALLRQVSMTACAPLSCFGLEHRVVSSLDEAALLQDPLPYHSSLLLRHFKGYHGDHFIRIGHFL